MEVDVIRKAHRKVPFVPFELRLTNGERYRIPHPEALWVTDHALGALDEEGIPVLLDPSAVVTLHRLRAGARSDGNSRGKK